MLQLTSTSDLVQVVTSAAADIEPHASWVDNAAGTITPGRTNTASITTATTTTVVPSPASSTQRRVKVLSLRNNHGSTACDVTVQHTDGTNVETLVKVTLAAGEALVLDETGEWSYYNGTGVKVTLPPVATQADMEAATTLLRVVPPGRVHFHPGMVKFLCSAHMIESVPRPMHAYNLTSITDTATGRVTFNIATDFSNTNYAVLASCERTVTTLGVADTAYCNIRNATLAAGSYEIETYDGAATPALGNENAYHTVGLGDQA